MAAGDIISKDGDAAYDIGSTSPPAKIAVGWSIDAASGDPVPNKTTNGYSASSPPLLLTGAQIAARALTLTAADDGDLVKATTTSDGYDDGYAYTFNGGTLTYDETEYRTAGGAIPVRAQAFIPSDYTGKLTSVEAGVTEAIATGATAILVQNLELTSITEFAVVAFGTSAANAQTNLGKTGSTPNIISESGVVVRSGDSTLGILPESRLIGVPALATHFAIGNGAAADDQVCMVTQGVGGV